MIRALALATAFAAAFGCGAARAQTADQLRNAVIPAARPAQSAPKHEDSPEAPPRGVAQTSIERRFAHDRASGAVGFLCGRDADKGGETPFGDDPHGRFVGAKLSFALR